MGELSKVCSQISLKSFFLERIGRPDILWSVDKLARAVTKWTRACDRRLARLISYIRNTSRSKHSCHVGNAAEHCRLGLFQDSHFAGDLEDSKSTPGGFYVFSGVKRSFQKVGCARSKLQFHTFSTESEAMSSDAGLRIDGVPALDLWDLVTEVLHPPSNHTPRAQGDLLQSKHSVKHVPMEERRSSLTQSEDFGLTEVPNANLSRFTFLKTTKRSSR